MFGQVAQQYQQQPDILHSLLGNKALMATAAILGAEYMSDHYKPGMGDPGDAPAMPLTELVGAAQSRIEGVAQSVT